MRKTALVLGVVVATAVATGIALATTTGVEIKACYDKQSGQMRIYDAGLGSTKACGTKEQPISWNQTGSQGPTGLAGADGDDGAQGPQGPAGDDGQGGAQGAQGPAGADGQNGVSGYARFFAHVTVFPNTAGFVKAYCASGQKVLGGGFDVGTTGSGWEIEDNAPGTDSAGNDYWFVTLTNYGPSVQDTLVRAYAICASVS